MEKIRISFQTRHKLDQLVDILYSKEYFGFKESCQAYVNAIYDFIYSIPNRKHYKTIKSKYGRYYCRYKPNKSTTYFITFDIIGDNYFVKNIIANHTREYPIYISGE